jgi:dihydrofolate synthase/folylpolyglutamate synthase
LHYYGIKRKFKGLEVGLIGGFQYRNAALALAITEILERKGFLLSDQDIIKGLKRADWPGRMHIVSKKPLIILDGAHNPKAVREMAYSIRTGFTYKQLVLVIGVMKDKDVATIVQRTVSIADYVIYTRPGYSRSAAPENLMREAAPLRKAGEAQPLISKALDRAREIAGPEDLILVCGSLFTVGEALTYFDADKYRPDDIS